jgi:hypothetical protein
MDMYTRKQYMNRECDHQTYYAQFVTESHRRLVDNVFKVERLASYKDQVYFNDAANQRWDNLAGICHQYTDRSKLKQAGEGWSLTTNICILKEAARQLVEAYWANTVA